MEEDINKIISRLLSGQGTKEDKHALDLWLETSEEHKKQYGLLQNAWKSQVPYDRVLNKDEVFERVWERATMVDTREDRKAKSVRWPLVWKVAASLIALVSIAYFLHHRPKPEPRVAKAQMIEKANPKGQKTRIALRDGSYVWLNADSKLTYPSEFGENARELQLAGEAFFEVAKDPQRPFRVKAGGLTVEALGTSFNINVPKNGQKSSVALSTGKVRVTLAGCGRPPVTLAPGRKATVGPKGQSLSIGPFSYLETIAWKDDIIYFKNASLGDVAHKLSDWYGVEFHISGKPSAPWHYSGQFDHDILDNVLRSLSFAEKFDYAIRGDSVDIKF